jgi:hypothetical protein
MVPSFAYLERDPVWHRMPVNRPSLKDGYTIPYRIRLNFSFCDGQIRAPQNLRPEAAAGRVTNRRHPS